MLIKMAEDDLQELLLNIICQQSIQTVFQPIVSLRDGSVFGYEALSRGPANTALQNPEKLFTYAIECGKLWELEYLCRTKSLEAAAELQVEGKLFLNVNPNIMNDPKFKQGFTKDFLTNYQMVAEDIIFEITEREAITNLADFKKTVNHYKNQSYQIAIDDVGSGYSGLNIITDIHPHFMKLDMNLIRGIDKDSTKQTLVRSLCQFAEMTNIRIIAEGIETEEELLTVLDIGIHYGQGYYIQRPIPSPSPLSAELVKLIVDENGRKQRVSPHRQMEAEIEQITTTFPTLDSSVCIDELVDLFDAHHSIPGFCITNDNRLMGIIMRNKFQAIMSGNRLIRGKPIPSIMSKEFLMVETTAPICDVATLAMMRTPENLYDFIVVTKSGSYVGVVTVRELLEKSKQIEVDYAKQLNPLTELPGNLLIEQELQKYIDTVGDHCVLYFDLDNFKPYNDVYGFVKGNQLLTRLAKTIKDVIGVGGFVGHIGGDDFIVITTSENSVTICEQIIEQFDTFIHQFYLNHDLENGYIISENRQGIEEYFPLVTLSIAGVVNFPFQSTFELAKKVSELKCECKRISGSTYLIADGLKE